MPRNLTGLFASNSAAKEWCPHTGAVVTNRVTPAIQMANFFVISITLLLLSILFRRACAAQIVPQTVIAFRTGVLKDRTVDLRHENLTAPGFLPGGRIRDRKLIRNSVGIGSCEPFHHMQVLAGAPERGPVGEVGGIHDQRIAFPVPA